MQDDVRASAPLRNHFMLRALAGATVLSGVAVGGISLATSAKAPAANRFAAVDALVTANAARPVDASFRIKPLSATLQQDIPDSRGFNLRDSGNARIVMVNIKAQPVIKAAVPASPIVAAPVNEPVIAPTAGATLPSAAPVPQPRPAITTAATGQSLSQRVFGQEATRPNANIQLASLPSPAEIQAETPPSRVVRRLSPYSMRSIAGKLHRSRSAMAAQNLTVHSVVAHHNGEAYTVGDVLSYIHIEQIPGRNNYHQFAACIAKNGFNSYAMNYQATDREFGLAPGTLSRIVQRETGTGYDCAVSRARDYGAKGRFQIMDETGDDLGVTNPFDPSHAVRGAGAYLRTASILCRQNFTCMAAAYNSGIENVRNNLSRNRGQLNVASLPAETRTYVVDPGQRGGRRIRRGGRAATVEVAANTPNLFERIFGSNRAETPARARTQRAMSYTNSN